MSDLLPEGFEDLEPYVAGWGLPTEAERLDRRSDASMEEHSAFYEAIRDAWPRVADYLKDAPAEPSSVQAERLMHLAMMAMESGVAVVLFKRQTSPLAIHHRRLTFLHDN